MYLFRFQQYCVCNAGTGIGVIHRDCIRGFKDVTCPSTETTTIECSEGCHQWQPWGAWSACDKQAEPTERERTRVCPDSADQEIDCVGEASQTEQCNPNM